MPKHHKKSSLNISSSAGNKKSVKQKEKTTEPTIKLKEDTIIGNDIDCNSGFGHYLRSNEGIGMMKLFVVANSIVVIITMAWPSMKEIYRWIQEYFSAEY